MGLVQCVGAVGSCRGGAVSRVRRLAAFALTEALAFGSGGLVRGLITGQEVWLVASAGEVSVNDQTTFEPTRLAVGDVVTVAGQGDLFFPSQRWARLSPRAEVVLDDGEAVGHRGGIGWYRAVGEPLTLTVGGAAVVLEGAALVVDDVIVVPAGAALVDGLRVTAGQAVVAGALVDLAPDQVFGDPWVQAHLEADHRSEALAGTTVPTAESSLLGEFRAELTVISSEFTDEARSRLEREADVVLRCPTRPCQMVLLLARSHGRVELPLIWTGAGFTSEVSTTWPCLTDQRLVGEEVYQADLELELDPSGAGTLDLRLGGSSQADLCHPEAATFSLTLGEQT